MNCHTNNALKVLQYKLLVNAKWSKDIFIVNKIFCLRRLKYVISINGRGKGGEEERRKRKDASMSERAHSNSMLGRANATLSMKVALRKLHTGFGLNLRTKIRAWFLLVFVCWFIKSEYLPLLKVALEFRAQFYFHRWGSIPVISRGWTPVHVVTPATDVHFWRERDVLDVS